MGGVKGKGTRDLKKGKGGGGTHGLWPILLALILVLGGCATTGKAVFEMTLKDGSIKVKIEETTVNIKAKTLIIKGALPDLQLLTPQIDH